MGIKRRLIIASAFVLFGLLPNFSFSQSNLITNGIRYLELSQFPDGYWGEVPEVSCNTVVDTCIVAESLRYLNETSSAYDSGIRWINSMEVLNNDYLFAKMLVLGPAGYDVSSIRDYMLSAKNTDGGWGVSEGFESDIKRTALALQALKATNYSDQNIISSALGFLLSTQNPDGGWGFYPSACSNCEADLSNVYMTAMVLSALSQYRTIYNLETAINKGVAYLLTRQNPDGGVGSSPSTVYETALSFLALVESGADISTVAPQAINYLTSTQLPNGSWNDDPYSTALALRALAHVKPNLSIIPTDITFSNPNPRIGDTITITARVYNEGPAVANNIVVQFFDGDPSSTGVLIGEVTISTITAFGNNQTSMNWTVPTASLRKVYVRIDPLNTIDELDETDNVVFRNLTSSTMPDLTLGSADITFSPDPARIGDPVTIRVTVRNHGQSGAENFLVYVYAGDPDQGGSTIAQANYSYLEGGSTNSFQFIWTVVQGVDRITVRIDPLGQVTESNENNNQAYRLLATISPPVEGIDLVAVPNSLSFSPGIGQVGQPVTMTAVVFNNGTIGATNITVDFFDHGPSGSTQKIHGTVISSLGPGQKQTISFQYSSFTKGPHTIYMEVDPQNLIQEANENNNEICAGFTVIKVRLRVLLQSQGISEGPQREIRLPFGGMQ